MEEEHATRLKKMKRSQHELQDKLSQMMEVVMSLASGKRIIEGLITQVEAAPTEVSNNREDPLYLLGFTLP